MALCQIWTFVSSLHYADSPNYWAIQNAVQKTNNPEISLPSTHSVFSYLKRYFLGKIFVSKFIVRIKAKLDCNFVYKC